ncbi:DUF4158 domain-containing protein [Nonomuraea sp. NBC_00507]|uniref:DUF4158 domain-containing protein n=1 Tax=Nonomuraea sp. NBC_00507 TaxID=2976002 RepID=UPI002E191933
MPHEYLSDEQVGRYGRFMADPTPEELERFFFLDEAALAEALKRRGQHNRLGWSLQWGTARMLGTFLTDSGPAEVPEVAIRYVAEQLGIEDWTVVKEYGDRWQTPYDHAAQIRKLLKYREFGEAEAEVAEFIASRVAKTRDSKRELFDRAVLWLIENRVLLPGITTVSRLVTEVRRAGLTAINKVLVEAAPRHMRGELVATLTVPEGKKVSVLEWMRTAVTKLSGTGLSEAFDRSAYVLGLGTGAVDCSAVAPVKMAELARFGTTAKAFRIRQLEDDRREATLVDEAAVAGQPGRGEGEAAQPAPAAGGGGQAGGRVGDRARHPTDPGGWRWRCEGHHGERGGGRGGAGGQPGAVGGGAGHGRRAAAVARRGGRR